MLEAVLPSFSFFFSSPYISGCESWRLAKPGRVRARRVVRGDRALLAQPIGGKRTRSNPPPQIHTVPATVYVAVE